MTRACDIYPTSMDRRGGGQARRIGSTFLRAAMGPIEYAAGCILANRIQNGLEELAPDALLSGYQRGITDVAALVGVSRTEVEPLLPMAEAERVGQRLLTSQKSALAAWKLHAGPFGFIDVITALTVDGRRPDIGLCIERLAQKVRHDKALSVPLMELARDMTGYVELVAKTRAQLEDGTWLETTLRRRQLKRTVFASLAVLSLIALTTSVVVIRLNRDDATALVAKASDCDAGRLTDQTLRWATEETLSARDNKRTACAEREAAEKKEAEERAAALEKERVATELIAKRTAACKLLGEETASGTLSDASVEVATTHADLVKRIAARKLIASDYGPEDPAFPCADTKDGESIEAAFKNALLAEPAVWARHPNPSAYLGKVLVEVKDKLPNLALIGLADNAERTAKSALSRGEKDTIVRAKKICALAKLLGVSGHSGCSGIENL